MIAAQRAVVANTDRAWFDCFRLGDGRTHVDEVNFWRPVAQQEFKALSPGEPFFFRLKHPINAIAGFGFFAVQSFMTVAMAWEIFGDRNGDLNYSRFLDRLAGYRRTSRQHPYPLAQERLNCLVLREATFLPEHEWIPWAQVQGWAPNIVAYKTIDLVTQPGSQLANLIASVPRESVADLASEFVPLEIDQRIITERDVVDRVGQGTFRTRLLRVYKGQCAVTRERAAPALDAAHIQPYLGPASNHV